MKKTSRIAKSLSFFPGKLFLETLRLFFRFDKWHTQATMRSRPYRYEIAKIANELSPLSVLEAGCGLGFILEQIKAPIRLGFDFDREVIRAASWIHRGKSIRFNHCNFFDFSPSGQIDLMICVNWLHDYSPELIKELFARLLPHTGYLLLDFVDVSTPGGYKYCHSKDSLPSQFRLLKEFRVSGEPRTFTLYLNMESPLNRREFYSFVSLINNPIENRGTAENQVFESVKRIGERNGRRFIFFITVNRELEPIILDSGDLIVFLPRLSLLSRVIYLPLFMLRLYEPTEKLKYSTKSLFEIAYQGFSLEHLKVLANATSSYKVLSRFFQSNFTQLPQSFIFAWGDALALGYIVWARERKTRSFQILHGYDLYNERRKNAIIPFHNEYLKSADKVFVCSSNGRYYLEEKYPQYVSKIRDIRFGAPHILTSNKHSFEFGRQVIFLSVSRIHKVKRLNLIYCLLDDLSKRYPNGVRWVHFGCSRDQFNSFHRGLLSDTSRLITDFRGEASRDAVLDYLAKRDASYFVNASESEGLSLAILEAMAAKLPIIATDNLGNRELVDRNNGILINGEGSIAENSSIIYEYMKSSDWGKASLASYEKWRRNFRFPDCVDTVAREFL